MEQQRRVVLPQARAYQREVYESGARFKLVLCGRRWGKTMLALVAACAGHGPEREQAAGGGLVALQELRAAVDFPVVAFEVKGSSRMARQEAVSPLAEAGKVWLPAPERAPWIRQWLAELVGFPHLAHDDRADAAAMALQRLRTHVEAYHVVLPPPRWLALDDEGDGWWSARERRY